ncbi:uncharacterized protein LOC135576111 [Columba livia]|uniref:uncharacterized protein LOC135576111 n=1 Tax=Columba livia TaxID=8932 RepID=UPI0031B9E1E3
MPDRSQQPELMGTPSQLRILPTAAEVEEPTTVFCGKELTFRHCVGTTQRQLKGGSQPPHCQQQEASGCCFQALSLETALGSWSVSWVRVLQLPKAAAGAVRAYSCWGVLVGAEEESISQGANLWPCESPVKAVTLGRAQVQQKPSAETTEGIGISINCSHPKIDADFTHWYRQIRDQRPELVATGVRGTKTVQDPPGRLSVAADRRSSALWLERPRRGDAAVYYCAVRDTGRGAGAAAGHEQPRAGPGGCGGGRGTVPDESARGRCRSALWVRLDSSGPVWPRGGSPARAAPAPASTSAPSSVSAGRRQKYRATVRRNRERSGAGVRRCPGRSDCSRWLPARSSDFLLCRGR